MHQDYSHKFVADNQEDIPSEEKCGEIIVKRLLSGNRGHYGCYSADTEVLSERGWIAWNKVRPDDKLLAVDIKTGSSRFEKPKYLQIVPLKADDLMYEVKSNYINLKVTKDHRMVVCHRGKNNLFSDWYFREAGDVYKRPVKYQLATKLIEESREIPEVPKGLEVESCLKMAGFYFGGGVKRIDLSIDNAIDINAKVKHKVEYIEALGIEIELKHKGKYKIKNQEYVTWLKREFHDNNGFKQVPIWLMKADQKSALGFLDGLKYSSSSRIRKTSWCYENINEEHIDRIQAIACLNNLSANKNIVCEAYDGLRDYYGLTISGKTTYRVEASQTNRNPGAVENFVKYTGDVYCATVSTGALLVRRNGKAVVSGNCLEHPSITFNCGYVPHSVLQQARTHRIGVTFDCQSMRYTSKSIIMAAEGGWEQLEKSFYLRNPGWYRDRNGKKYEYTEEQRKADLNFCKIAAEKYKKAIEYGMSEEQARGLLPFDYRQHFIVSFNMRSFLHFMDLRSKKDAQIEIQLLCDLMWNKFNLWTPAIASWYHDNRLHKATLSP